MKTSTLLEKPFPLIKKHKLIRKILNNRGPKTEQRATPKSISSHKLYVILFPYSLLPAIQVPLNDLTLKHKHMIWTKKVSKGSKDFPVSKAVFYFFSVTKRQN